MGKIKRHHIVTAAAALVAAISAGPPAPAYGSETAGGTIVLASSELVGGQRQYTYDLSLTNTSTDGSTVGTFWFAWIPHQSYLASNPITVSGWPDEYPLMAFVLLLLRMRRPAGVGRKVWYQGFAWTTCVRRRCNWRAWLA